MRRYLIATALFFLLSLEPFAASAARSARGRPIDVQILAFNDFHGNIESPKLAVPLPDSHGSEIQVPAGGAAYLAGALEKLRKAHRFTITVSAGDLIGSDDAEFERVEAGVTLERLTGILDERAREILRLRFQDDLLQSEIADRVGCSQMHVSRIIRASLEKLYAYGAGASG